MKLPSFTLVHQPKAVDDQKPSANEHADLFANAPPELLPMLQTLPRALGTAVVASALGPSHETSAEWAPEELSAGESSAALATVETVVRELTRQEKVLTVGLWDIDARVPRLARLAEALNEPQSALAFFEVQAAIPAGLVRGPEGMVAWLRRRQKRLSKDDRKDIEANLVAEDFYERARVVRHDLGLDYLVGVTRYMVAGVDDERPYWNHFSTGLGRLRLVSAFDLRRQAGEAKRAFEVAVGLLIVGQLLVALSPRLGFHPDRHCIFDYTEDRNAVPVLARPVVEAVCLGLMPVKYRATAEALVAALAAYPRPS